MCVLPEGVNSLTISLSSIARGSESATRASGQGNIGEWPLPGPEVCLVLRAFYAPDD